MFLWLANSFFFTVFKFWKETWKKHRNLSFGLLATSFTPMPDPPPKTVPKVVQNSWYFRALIALEILPCTLRLLTLLKAGCECVSHSLDIHHSTIAGIKYFAEHGLRFHFTSINYIHHNHCNLRLCSTVSTGSCSFLSEDLSFFCFTCLNIILPPCVFFCILW